MITTPSGPTRYGFRRLAFAIVVLGSGVWLGISNGSILWLPAVVIGLAIGWLVARVSARPRAGRQSNARLVQWAAVTGVTISIVLSSIGGTSIPVLVAGVLGFLGGVFLSIWASKLRDVEVML